MLYESNAIKGDILRVEHDTAPRCYCFRCVFRENVPFWHCLNTNTHIRFTHSTLTHCLTFITFAFKRKCETQEQFPFQPFFSFFFLSLFLSLYLLHTAKINEKTKRDTHKKLCTNDKKMWTNWRHASHFLIRFILNKMPYDR